LERKKKQLNHAITNNALDDKESTCKKQHEPMKEKSKQKRESLLTYGDIEQMGRLAQLNDKAHSALPS
jgi:hypothetical protein